MAKFLDVLLSAIAIFFVTFCWGYYVLRDAKTALLVSTIVALCASYIVWRIVESRSEKVANNKRKKAQLQSFAHYFGFCENAVEVFCDLLKYYRFDVVERQNDGIVAVKNAQRCYVALLFDNDIVTLQEVRRVVKGAKRAKADRLIAFCIAVKNTEIQLAKGQLPSQFVSVEDAYALFEQADKLPPLNKPTVKKSAYFCQFAFSKKRFGGYFASGIFLLVTSALTFFPLYSIVWGTALLGVALYSLLNKKYNVAKTVVTLE